jgi:hypothetical protein
MRQELGVPVHLVHGHYGEFKVLIDEETVVDGGPLAFLGVLPSTREIMATVRASLTIPDDKTPAS